MEGALAVDTTIPTPGADVLVALGRSSTYPRITLVAPFAGGAADILADLFTFSANPMPIVPHERAPGAFSPPLTASLARITVVGV